MGTGLTSVPQPYTTCRSLGFCSKPQGPLSWGTELEVWWLRGSPHPSVAPPPLALPSSERAEAASALADSSAGLLGS